MENTYISFKNSAFSKLASTAPVTQIQRSGRQAVSGDEIEVTSVSFRPRTCDDGDRELTGYPRRMVYDGREYNFVELSMQYLVRKGQAIISLFDMRDERGATYRLRNEDNRWTLVSMKGAC